jgi:dienelactone hydrolase
MRSMAEVMGAAESRPVFAYDAKEPLDVQVTSEQVREGAVVQEINYISPRGGRATAALIRPAVGKGPFAGVVFSHWLLGGKQAFLQEAVGLARLGVVSLLVDTPTARPSPWFRPLNLQDDFDTLSQGVVDLRRGMDLLVSRPDVDAQRIGFVGHSVGAQYGVILAAVDRRFRAMVLMAGPPSFTDMLALSPRPMPTQWRKLVPQELQAPYFAKMAPLDAHHYLEDAAPTPFFFQFARDDEAIPEEEAMRFVKAAREPRVFRFYEGGHGLNDSARRDRVDWLQIYLGFESPPAFGPRRVGPLAADVTPPPEATFGELMKLSVVDELPGMDEQRVEKDLIYTRTGGRELALDVYIPEEIRNRPRLPAVVLLHGQTDPRVLARIKDGRRISGLARRLATSGLVVVVPNLGTAATGPEPEKQWAGVTDVAANTEAAIAYAREHAEVLHIDPDRLGVLVLSTGGTYGFRAAYQGTPPYVKCAVGLYPVLSDAPLRRHLPDEVRGEYSPVEHVRARGATLPPTLLVRAGRDLPDINREIDAFAAEARERNAPVTVLSLPDAHHGFDVVDDYEDSRRAIRQVAEFLVGNLNA